MHSHLEAARPIGIGAATALAILTDATDRLDVIRAEAESELARHVRSRTNIETLIERLIAGLDDLDQGDEDREPWLSGSAPEDCDREGHGHNLDEDTEAVNEDGDELDAGEAVNEDGDPTEGAEPTMPESYGRGWTAEDADEAKNERLFSNITVGALAQWRGGKLAQVHAISIEERARA